MRIFDKGLIVKFENSPPQPFIDKTGAVDHINNAKRDLEDIAAQNAFPCEMPAQIIETLLSVRTEIDSASKAIGNPKVDIPVRAMRNVSDCIEKSSRMPGMSAGYSLENIQQFDSKTVAGTLALSGKSNCNDLTEYSKIGHAIDHLVMGLSILAESETLSKHQLVSCNVALKSAIDYVDATIEQLRHAFHSKDSQPRSLFQGGPDDLFPAVDGKPDWNGPGHWLPKG